jgi:hypothetical protein
MLEKFFGSSYEQIDDVPKAWDDDPVAQKTEWSPEKSGGTNFRTHRLERVGVTRMEFRLTLGAKLFCWLFISMGVGIPLSIVSQEIRRPNTEFVSILFVAFIGIVFAGVGFGMQHFMGKPRVFDKTSGRFWRGTQEPDLTRPQAEGDDFLALDQIYALQLLSEYVSGNKSSYHSYELNLVLDNGRRVNVIDHGSLRSLRDDARTLARFLNVPVWDAT